MRIFSKYVLFLLLGVGFSACSQKQEIMQNQNITADNIAEEITKEVIHYSNEPMYVFTQYAFMCYFEIYIDGVLIAKNFDNLLADGFDINRVMFKSGRHKVTYKLYPLGKYNKYDTNYPTLLDHTNFTLSLGSYDQKNDQAGNVEYIKYEVPKIETKVTKDYSTYRFEGAGKTYYEGSFDINVDVPYELHPPFEKAQDLRKMDKKQLETKLLAKYKEIWNVYENKEYDNIAKLEYHTLRDLYVSNYDSKETINENISILFDKIYKSSTFQMQPIEKYKLEFFADGKMVALMLDTTDNRFRGNTVLWAKANYDGGVRAMFINRYFYIPQGETEFKVY